MKSYGWFKVNAGLNSFTGCVTEEMKQNIYHPEPDLDMFVSRLKEEILNNQSFVIKAEDTGDTAELDAQQKEQLADAISDISDYLLFDGAVSASREAAYPFYRLDFGEYGMVVTTDDRLLVLMDSDTAYDYGIGREGMAVKFVTPNIEFIIREVPGGTRYLCDLCE